MIRVCPERDARCPHGINCPYWLDRGSCKPEGLARPTPVPETPAPIPTDVLALVARARKLHDEARRFAADACHPHQKMMVLANHGDLALSLLPALATAVEALADRAAQTERVREDEPGDFVQLPDGWLAIELKAVEDEFAKWSPGMRESFENLLRPSDRARLREGDR